MTIGYMWGILMQDNQNDAVCLQKIMEYLFTYLGL